MGLFLLQVLVPFVLSALIVVFITIIAERYGTKIGGIIGALPHLIIVAFVFIALNKGVDFASKAALVVPAEMGVNIMFLLLFTHLCHRSLDLALGASLGIWALLSALLVAMEFPNIFVSLLVYVLVSTGSFLMLEKVRKVRSTGQVKVEYTPRKMVFRGVLAGTVITTAVLLSEIGSVISGIFSVFPALFLSTMIITHLEHGPDFSKGMAKSMIFGTPSVVSYAVGVNLLYPGLGILWGTLSSAGVAVVVGITVFSFREQMM